jgi:diadenylate cyclase
MARVIFLPDVNFAVASSPRNPYHNVDIPSMCRIATSEVCFVPRTASGRRPRDQESVEDRSEAPNAQRWRVLDGAQPIKGLHYHVRLDNRQQTGKEGMQSLRMSDQFKTLFSLAVRMTESSGVDAILLLLEGPADWPRLRNMAPDAKILVAADTIDQLAGAKEAGLEPIRLEMPDNPANEKLAQAVLEAVADDILAPGSAVVALYSSFDADSIDSLSLINLDEHLNRLSGRDLRQLETRVPLDTLKMVVDLAVEIGREGREGHPVGTLIVVGDSRKVLACSRPVGFDPVKGYSRKERNLNDPRVREGIKEIAQMDGAIIVSTDGTVEATCRYLDCSAADVTLSKGLGARHWAAAAISRATNAVAVTVSQSNGTVRIFQNGETVLRIEPYSRRPMVWRDLDDGPLPAGT